MPRDMKINIPKERSLVDFVFHILITCGRKEAVVIVPAIKPITISKPIIILLKEILLKVTARNKILSQLFSIYEGKTCKGST